MTYSPITNAEIAPGAPASSITATKFRDNPIAIADGSQQAAGIPTTWQQSLSGDPADVGKFLQVSAVACPRDGTRKQIVGASSTVGGGSNYSTQGPTVSPVTTGVTVPSGRYIVDFSYVAPAFSGNFQNTFTVNGRAHFDPAIGFTNIFFDTGGATTFNSPTVNLLLTSGTQGSSSVDMSYSGGVFTIAITFGFAVAPVDSHSVRISVLGG